MPKLHVFLCVTKNGIIAFVRNTYFPYHNIKPCCFQDINPENIFLPELMRNKMKISKLHLRKSLTSKARQRKHSELFSF